MDETSRWERVTIHKPCPICGKPDWCGRIMDVICCMRVQSERPTKNGGWIHVLKINSSKKSPTTQTKTQKKISEVFKMSMPSLMNSWIKTTTQSETREFAVLLGLPSVKPLECLSAAWSFRHHAWAFPMRNSNNEITGIRLRDKSGKKWTVTGSKQGLFIPQPLPPADFLLICEGPTDTAAALSLGYSAIGRPCCRGCEFEVNQTIAKNKFTNVVIVADNDQPGIDGANALASSLFCLYKIITLPKKDMREFVKSGGKKEVIDCIINQQLWKGKYLRGKEG